ncbi:unnamed protein product [Protopolystoma xenopodis]|uniref:Uncharacterized protein n=1 Tax=Protopolystoma xenopodis TaxID=117903 RepID=A0A3S5B8J6_9PLAT|nr:unnamed protein product [Protopolystoma xenopodis]
MARLTAKADYDAGKTSGNAPRPRSDFGNDHAYNGLRTSLHRNWYSYDADGLLIDYDGSLRGHLVPCKRAVPFLPSSDIQTMEANFLPNECSGINEAAAMAFQFAAPFNIETIIGSKILNQSGPPKSDPFGIAYFDKTLVLRS